jgi:hypothetical protein
MTGIKTSLGKPWCKKRYTKMDLKETGWKGVN